MKDHLVQSPLQKQPKVGFKVKADEKKVDARKTILALLERG